MKVIRLKNINILNSKGLKLHAYWDISSFFDVQIAHQFDLVTQHWPKSIEKRRRNVNEQTNANLCIVKVAFNVKNVRFLDIIEDSSKSDRNGAWNVKTIIGN